MGGGERTGYGGHTAYVATNLRVQWIVAHGGGCKRAISDDKSYHLGAAINWQSVVQDGFYA